MNETADAVISRLGLERHPEGGWYRETWRAEADGGERSDGTCIHFLLRKGERSHWHRIDATELWLHQGGGPLCLRTACDGERVVEHKLGSDGAAGEGLQVMVKPGEWQSAQTQAPWSLAACVVVPGFEFAGFELAPLGWEPPAA